MKPASYRTLIDEGTVKRADAMKVRYPDIHVEPGFNLRDETEEFHESVRLLATYILGGGVYPPLEVRPRQEGGVWIVDGHRRHRAIGLAIESGAPIEWIEIRAFNGNDADRTYRVITSAEGRALSPLETARGYRKLIAFGQTVQQIAVGVNRSENHVRNLLSLGNANSDVHTAITSGVVSATVAGKIVREHGEQAGEVIAAAAETAKASGKRKVTAAAIKPRPLTTARVRSLVDEIQSLRAALADDVAANLADLGENETVSVPAGIIRNILSVIGENS